MPLSLKVNLVIADQARKSNLLQWRGPTAEDGAALGGQLEKGVLQLGPLVQDVDQGLAVHHQRPLRLPPLRRCGQRPRPPGEVAVEGAGREGLGAVGEAGEVGLLVADGVEVEADDPLGRVAGASVELDDLHVLGEELARVGDVDGGFLGEHKREIR